jgi:ABC-type lipoprotein export system ATPase subunit
MLIAGKLLKERARELLERVGMEGKMNRKLGELSGGEQQRVAISIALANNPRLLLADEPTGSVDTKMADQILDLLRELNRSMKITTVIVTHDMRLAKKVDRVVAIRDGKTSSELIRRKSYAEELAEIEAGIEQREEETHEELAVLDRAGRLQIPREYLEALGLDGVNKIKVELEDGKIVLIPPQNVEEAKKDA